MYKKYYPLFVSLDQRRCLVIGAGPVAERKIRNLVNYGAIIRLVAQHLTPWLQARCAQREIDYLGETFQTRHLEEVDLVFVATNDAELNQRIASEASARRLWCNMASDPQLGSCIVPAMVERGPLSIAISTAGISPASARLIRENLEQQFGAEWVALLALLAKVRAAIQTKSLGTSENQRLFREIAGLPLLEWIRNRQHDSAVQALYQVCQARLTVNELSTFWQDACETYFSSPPPPVM
jgi:precorrin-2 dehydrogenase/sirohydrochlorin ferrochelatase